MIARWVGKIMELSSIFQETQDWLRFHEDIKFKIQPRKSLVTINTVSILVYILDKAIVTWIILNQIDVFFSFE